MIFSRCSVDSRLFGEKKHKQDALFTGPQPTSKCHVYSPHHCGWLERIQLFGRNVPAIYPRAHGRPACGPLTPPPRVRPRDPLHGSLGRSAQDQSIPQSSATQPPPPRRRRRRSRCPEGFCGSRRSCASWRCVSLPPAQAWAGGWWVIAVTLFELFHSKLIHLGTYFSSRRFGKFWGTCRPPVFFPWRFR